MATGGQGPGGGAISGINITPFVDVTLVLLVIFLVTARLMPFNARTVPVALPRAASAELRTPVHLLVAIDRGGGLSVRGAKLDDEAFKRLAQQEVRNEAGLQVVIAADGEVPHRRVVEVMDVLRTAGVEAIGVAVRPPSGGAP